jgi:hypothetical protein
MAWENVHYVSRCHEENRTGPMTYTRSRLTFHLLAVIRMNLSFSQKSEEGQELLGSLRNRPCDWGCESETFSRHSNLEWFACLWSHDKAMNQLHWLSKSHCCFLNYDDPLQATEGGASRGLWQIIDASDHQSWSVVSHEHRDRIAKSVL